MAAAVTKVAEPSKASAAIITPTPKRILASHGERLRSWKAVVIESLGRELSALHCQQQERAFMATSHGLNYSAAGSRSAALH